MKNKFKSILICFLIFPSIIGLNINQSILAQKENTPPTFYFLAEDSITYFQVPENAELTITYQHVWAFGNATFSIFDQYGQFYDKRVFTYEESLSSKTIPFTAEGTYKMVATGVNFRYNIDFSGPSYDYKCVAAAMPHKAVFRVKNGETASAFIPVSSQDITFHITNDYSVPARDATIRIYDENDILKETAYMDSTDFLATYEYIFDFNREQSGQVFWRVEIEGHGGGQSRVVVWTNQSQFDLATGHCTLLTPDPSCYFVPFFQPRTTTLSYSDTNHTAFVGSSGYVEGDSEEADIYRSYISNLDLKSSKKWVSWAWRERQGSIAMNDDSDPFHINWAGFNMDPFDNRMVYYQQFQIKPILCLQWDTSAFISTHPAYWDQNDIDEFAEFCLAIAIHCVAPDLKDPPVDREPYDIFGIMPFNEPNLIYSEKLGLTDSVEGYLSVLNTVGGRFRSHPDSRINQMSFVVPGSTMSLYSTDELIYWISEVVNHASEYADIIVWDQYSYYLLEEIDEYEKDIIQIRNILNNVGITRPLGLSEFGIHGGVPTSQDFYGSSFAKLYVFGALAKSISNDMTYPVYFTLIDPIHEARQKGLFTGISSYPPFSNLPPLIPKPQYYSMQIIGWICKGNILSTPLSTSQLDVLGSRQNDVYRFGISNRYEAPTKIKIPIESGTSLQIFEVTDTGSQLVENQISNGMVEFTMPAWSLYYVETVSQSNEPPTAFIDSISPNPANTSDIITFNGHGEDSDGTITSYLWLSDIDGPIGIKPSFTSDTLSPGIHNISFKVRDDDNAWSTDVTEQLVINEGGNQAPETPIISGEINGKIGVEYEYTFSSNDPDGDDVYYDVKWKETDKITTYGPYPSGEEITHSHTWLEKGDYKILIKARDIYGAESEWGTLDVTMPKYKSIFDSYLFNIIANLPFFQKFFSLFIISFIL